MMVVAEEDRCVNFETIAAAVAAAAQDEREDDMAMLS